MPPEAGPVPGMGGEGGGLADMVQSAIAEAMAGISAPNEAAMILREMADILDEQGGGAAPAPMDGGMPMGPEAGMPV
jgi:hypothetical protein